MMDEPRRRVEIKHFDALTKDELYRLLELRNRVFVVGQGITAEPEVDGLDRECEHAMLFEDGELVACARIFCEREPIVVGRVATATDRQRQGLGTDLMRAVQRHIGERPAELHAQAYLEEWYTRLGWVRSGEVFDEADIPHVMMYWPCD
jgi:ElaA protein